MQERYIYFDTLNQPAERGAAAATRGRSGMLRKGAGPTRDITIGPA